MAKRKNSDPKIPNQPTVEEMDGWIDQIPDMLETTIAQMDKAKVKRLTEKDQRLYDNELTIFINDEKASTGLV